MAINWCFSGRRETHKEESSGSGRLLHGVCWTPETKVRDQNRIRKSSAFQDSTRGSRVWIRIHQRRTPYAPLQRWSLLQGVTGHGRWRQYHPPRMRFRQWLWFLSPPHPTLDDGDKSDLITISVSLCVCLCMYVFINFGSIFRFEYRTMSVSEVITSSIMLKSNRGSKLGLLLLY